MGINDRSFCTSVESTPRNDNATGQCQQTLSSDYKTDAKLFRDTSFGVKTTRRAIAKFKDLCLKVKGKPAKTPSLSKSLLSLELTT